MQEDQKKPDGTQEQQDQPVQQPPAQEEVESGLDEDVDFEEDETDLEEDEEDEEDEDFEG